VWPIRVAAAVQHMFNTTRTRAPDPQARICGAARFHMYKYQAPSAIIPEAIKHVKQFPTIRRRFRLNVGLWEVQTYPITVVRRERMTVEVTMDTRKNRT